MKAGYDDETYGEAYWNGQKTYRIRVGDEWVTKTYAPPARHWPAFEHIARAIFMCVGKPANLLDVGCGAGSFVGACRREGVDAIGYDVSKYAIDNPAPDAEGFIWHADFTNGDRPAAAWPFMITALDLFEHIYMEDQDRLQRSIWETTARCGSLVACIGTASGPHDTWIHRKGEEIPIEKEWQAVSGHITVLPHSWWLDLLRSYGWTIDLTAMAMFEAWRTTTDLPGFAALEAWDARHFVVARKPA